jgi:hypothetical protein
MAELTRHSSAVPSVFTLLGTLENDLTAALGYTFARSHTLREQVLHRVWVHDTPPPNTEDVDLALEVRDEDGRTDLEMRLAGALVILEAKRGWILPTQAQLAKYAGRIAEQPGGGVLVTLSQASHDLAAAYGLPPTIDSIPIVHLPWTDVLDDIATARHRCRGTERVWLDELHAYLKDVIRMRSPEDCKTYCVVLNNAKPGDGGHLTFLQYVTHAHCYFHPYGTGNGWPTEPPNFLAFRWDGAVQRIHRVTKAEVIPTLLHRFPDVPANPVTNSPHALYHLGPRIPPLEPIPTGRNYRAARLWVLLDQLQTAPTLTDALDGTRELLT